MTHPKRVKRSVSVLDSPAVITCFDDVAMMCDAVEQCGCHFLVCKDRGPFTEGEIRADNNIFSPGLTPSRGDTDTHAIQGTWAGSGNAFLNGAFADSQSSSVFTPPYSYTLDPVGTAAEQQALRDRLEAEAGWQSDFAGPTPLAAPQNLRIVLP